MEVWNNVTQWAKITKKKLDFGDIFCPLCFDAMHCNSAQQNKGKLVSDDSESRFKRPFAKVFA